MGTKKPGRPKMKKGELKKLRSVRVSDEAMRMIKKSGKTLQSLVDEQVVIVSITVKE